MTVPELCNSLADAGHQVELFTIARGPVNVNDFRFVYREFPATAFLRKLSLSGEMHDALRAAAKQPVVMHSHSVWSMPCVYPTWVSRGNNVPARTVIAPHGTLAPYAFRWRWYRKAPFWWAAQKKALETCDCLHSTGEGESQDFRRLGLKQPIINIPNAIPVPADRHATPDPSRPRRLMFLGRLHPIKGLDTLLRSWRQVQDQFPGWELQLVGPENCKGYHAYLTSLAAELGCARVLFQDSVLGSAKDDAYNRADLFILPSHTEGFGLVVAEALAHSVPAIVCRGAPWAGLETNGCGWWVEHGEGPIAEALRDALALSDAELSAKGKLGRAWVERDFSHRRVAQLMGEAYAWLLGGGTPPECVLQ